MRNKSVLILFILCIFSLWILSLVLFSKGYKPHAMIISSASVSTLIFVSISATKETEQLKWDDNEANNK